MIGKIVFYHPMEQYGFISVENIDDLGKTVKDYFFHLTSFKLGEAAKLGEIKLEAMVVFDLAQPLALGKKQQAVNIRIATPIEIELAIGSVALAGGV